MKYYSILGTELNVSSIIMGCMRIASLTPKEVETLVRTAIDHGVNYFDHADIYGDGRCETCFGEALRLTGNLREELLIQGKCGIRRSGKGQNYYDFSQDHILRSFDGILSRLRTDYLDVLLLHLF
ncbi:MAG: aldo/keto reductase [Oscillospiraceae bacterium]|nr:aldo/keto reductase [Oscillospiraceae bacterium]